MGTIEPVRRDFDKEAAAWDTPPRVKLAQHAAAAIMARIPFTPSMDVLDFGCGTGLVSLALRPKVRSMTGADTSKGMLEVFEAKAAAMKLSGVRAILLDPGKETALRGKYDAIVSSMTLHHVAKIESLFASFYAALAPGGYAGLCDLDSDAGMFHSDPTGVFHQGFERAKVEELLRGAGFRDVRSEQAAQVTRPGADGVTRTFTIFLLSGRK